MIGIMFCFGFLCSVRLNVGYVYIMELLPEKYQNMVTTIWSVQEIAIYTFAVLYFWLISTHWFYYALMGPFF